ncbi:Neutral alpha-glucosidase C [Colletotrichum higginsianum]|uniref:alpha-glucosidase n=1 Tax=Colletotrichum higginsianum TaxID=80884 RepID=A0A4T0VN06_9PEZI|nr:Neutral alpha-glucosidase C [Colletotrichum higginsianum]
MDAPRAHDAIMGWVKNCEKHDIPFSAFQMSSGYTVAEKEPKTRNVFTWNYHRFPDPRAFTREAHAHGVRLLANVKPYVLATHPEYKKLSAAGAFFKDPNTGETAVTRLWSAGGGESGEGSHLDFTSNAGYQWWYDGVVGLKKVGIDVMWNDNNEYTVPDDDWQCALEKTDLVPIPEGLSRKDVGIWGRAIHTELMGKASHDATVEGKPEERPFVLTRSATAGTMKYCGASWSGDNVTAWESMRGGNSLALNASFSLLHCYGHDIGGFEGPQPTPEHLVRWIQLGVHSPRFAINCFKTSEEDNLIGGVIEPWMYPTATPIIRATIKRRYELVPYTYSQNLRAHHTAVPPQRWTGWGYEADPEVWTKEIKNGDTQYWFGDALVIGGVYEPGADTARVYLPKKGDGSDFGFLNTNAPYEHLEAGRWHTVLSPWYTSIPVLARVGAAVPVGRPLDTTSRAETDPEFPNQAKDDWRGVEIFPPPALRGSAAAAAAVGGSDAESGANDVKGVVFKDSWYEDDGISREVAAEYKFTIRYEIVDGRISVEVKGAVTEGSREGWSPLWLEKGVDVVLPVGEERSVITQGGEAVEKTLDAKGRRHGDSTALSNISAASWVASPVVRGSIDIIWTCVVTLGACVYTVLHLNVPAKNGRYAGLIDKLRWVVIAILFPEYVLVIAAYQLREAQNLRKELQKHLDNNASTSKQLVELDFCFFVIMGGYQVTIKDIQPGPEFTYNSNCEDIHRLSSEGFLRLVELGEINIETAVRTSHLKDRSKANIIQKALVLMQIGWMLLQCIARKAQGLPITLLELHTMVHVACAAAMYSFWFSKPLDIGYPEMLDSESETMRGFLALSVQSQLCKKNEIEFTIQTQELESNSTHPDFAQKNL